MILYLLLALVSPTYADIGIPMLMFVWPLMWVALIPVIALEGYVLLRRLRLGRGRCLKLAAVANLWSTILGIPLAWIILAFLEGVTGGGQSRPLPQDVGSAFLRLLRDAPWLLPSESSLIFPAMLLLLIPLYYASWFVEYQVISRLVEGSSQNISRAVRFANLASYALLGLAVAGLWAVKGRH